MRMLFNIIIGFALIVAGIWLLKDYIVPFFKAFAGVLLVMIGMGFLFARPVGHIRYRVR